MEKFKILSQKDRDSLTKDETKEYYKQLRAFLKEEENKELSVKAEREKAQNEKDKKKKNHARFIIIGSFLKSELAVDYVKSLALSTLYEKRDAEALNLLMEELGWAGAIQFRAMVTKESGLRSEDWYLIKKE